MNAAKIASVLSAAAQAFEYYDIPESAMVGDDASLHCIGETAFCMRTREFKLDQQQTQASDITYSLSDLQVHSEEGKSAIFAKLQLDCTSSGYLAKELELRLDFYEDGILRAEIDQAEHTRFQISKEDLPVVWEQLKPLSGFQEKVSQTETSLRVSGITREGSDDVYDYEVDFAPFQVRQFTNGQLSSKTEKSLYFEDGSSGSLAGEADEGTCFGGLRSRAYERAGMDIFGYEQDEKRQSVSWSFWLPGDHQTLYGIPEREDTLALKTTTGTDPYTIYATDHLHAPNEPGPLYGSIPYVMGLSDEAATSFLWVNSAKTTVDIDRPRHTENQGVQLTFASEANVLEFFMFTSGNKSANRVKQANKDLATISGFAPMPLLHTLGFHFCKWAPVSADMLMERNRAFSDYGFPIDVLWSDIEWAQQYDDPAGYEYFKFNPANFTDTQITQMNSEIEAAGRRIVVIVDPHIKASDDYFVYNEGMEMQEEQPEQGNYKNIFVRAGAGSQAPFYGDCWPGNSTWIDFLNTNAQEFWGGLFDYSVFQGSNYMYSFWNDMNEPAIFSTDTHTMPLDAVHVKADGTQFTHLEVHNAYGALHQRSSYRGLLKRDNNTQRPFVLTRSFFLGSQKFGAYWTGDNRSVFEELQGSITMIQQLGNSGHPFGGSDIPGFYGYPTDDLFVMFYQVGMWYPFMRAHSQDVMLSFPLKDREPYMQSSRVREAIRDAINRRYDLIHYIYSTFEVTTRTAEPLMRPMFSEFPDEHRFRGIASQFMFGSSLLVAPKVTRPDGTLKHMHMQEVTYALPLGETWYNYYSKQVEESTPCHQWVTTALTDLEQAVYVRGGSVLPILLHQDCMALLPCMRNDVRLEVYPDVAGEASGSLYLDDGSSYEFLDRDAKSARLTFSYAAGELSVAFEHGANYDSIPNTASVVIYGIENAPYGVSTADGQALDYVHEASTNTLYIKLAASTQTDKVSLKIDF